MAIGTPTTAATNVSLGAVSSGSITVTAGAGDRLFIAVGCVTSTSRTVSSMSGGGLTWSAADKAVSSASGFVEIWSAHCSSAVTAQSITVNLSGAILAGAIVAFKCSGIATSSAVDGSGASASNTTGVASWSTGNAVTTNANDLIVACGHADSFSALTDTPTGSVNTELIDYASANDVMLCVNYVIVAATQAAIAGTGNWSGTPVSNEQILVAYKEAAGGGTDATVSAVPADGVGDITTTAVSAGSTVVTGPADGVGDIPTMSVSGGGNVTVSAIIADGVGDIPTPTVRGSSTVTAVVADATGDIAANFPVSVDVGAVPADGVGDIPTPTISVPGGAVVAAVPADGVGDTPVPTVRGAVNLTATLADGIGFIPAPVVDDGVADEDTSIRVPSVTTIPVHPTLVRNT